MNNQPLPRRQFLLGAAAAGAVSLTAEAKPSDENNHPVLPQLRHSVFFWLKNPDSEADIAALIAGLKTLARIDSVKGIQIGVPASTEKRDVVDNSFQVSEMLLFDDVEGQNQYQVHPIHQQFVADCSHLWRKVVVYDSLAV
ncbi:Dabb family protein [Alteromonas gilva]|uniref:Dabb family protein n=1 Tax=Alteromonas gilva TaxID=2987522 RepID=A0ABT5L3M5_9ALTE|nr:Dabb family protein [Alteromonas gilva]MDC8830378.1 Dabb family protein [Alteromonas gilva]